MAKGAIAKENVAKKIIAAFGDDYIGEFDKKLYVWADDGGNREQISITLTSPKVYRGLGETDDDSSVLNFEDTAVETNTQPTGFQPADITQQEKDTLAELMAKLGL